MWGIGKKKRKGKTSAYLKKSGGGGVPRPHGKKEANHWQKKTLCGVFIGRRMYEEVVVDVG